jgi:hypothetical protein
LRISLDLNVWCAAILAGRAGRSDTALQRIVDAARGRPSRAAIQLVISWGMLGRLNLVLRDALGFPESAAESLTDAIVGYAEAGPSLTLGGVGVLPIHDPEDRHVLETAWAGKATALVTADFGGFLGADADIVAPGRLARLRRAGQVLHLIHPYPMAAWLRGEAIDGFEPEI